MKRISIKLRVTAWFTLIMTVTAGMIFFFMTAHRSSQIKADAKKTLTESVSMVSSALRKPFPPNFSPNGTDPHMPPNPEISELHPKMYRNGVHIAVYNDKQELLMGQIPFELGTLPFVNNSLRSVSSGGETYLVYDRMIQADSQTFWIKGVSNLSHSLSAANTTVITDFLLILFLILVASVGGYLIVRQALKPVELVSRTAKEITDNTDLSRRIQLGEGKDEIYSLAAVLDQMLDRLQSSFETEKQFTSDASHELRTPVAVILSECEYALDCAKSNEELLESVTVIKRQTDKMSGLITDLLSLSRMEHLSPIKTEETDISELLKMICEEQQEIQTEQFAYEIQPNIFCNAEPSLLARLFINLISNAFAYGNSSVHVRLTASKTTAVFEVHDDGPGIEKEELSKIWERFYQIDRSRSHSGGSMGLGLAMVKQIAKIHNGILHVESVPGKGSTFSYQMECNIKP